MEGREEICPLVPSPKLTVYEVPGESPEALKVTASGAAPEVGAAPNVMWGGGGVETVLTATVVCAVAEPALLVAVNVYVVVCEGETAVEAPLTEPIPEIESEVAPETPHESVALWPEVMEDGDAAKDVMVGTG